MNTVTNIHEHFLPLEDQNGRHAPALDWRGMKSPDHFVQFYESDLALVDAVSGYIGAGLDMGEGCIIIATQPHREAIEDNLQAQGLVVAQTHGQYGPNPTFAP